MPRQYAKEFKDRAVRLVTESREDYETEWAAIPIVASRLNVGGGDFGQVYAPLRN